MPNDHIDIRDFAPPGTPLDGTVDWAPYLQAAVDYITGSSVADAHRNGNSVGTLRMPPGKYRIDSPIQIVKRQTDTGQYDFVSIRIVGEAPGAPGTTPAAVSFHGTCIFTQFAAPTLPAIVIEGARAVRLENLMIYGQNDWMAGANTSGDQIMRMLYDDATFLLANARDDRYSPHAGICIDPYDNPAKPGSNWSAANRYPGLEAFYDFKAGDTKNGGAASSDVVIHDCVIQGFVVGVAISMSPLLQNAENIVLSKTTITSSKTCLAVGQGQSRNVVLYSAIIGGAKFGINCVDYGTGNGSCPSIFGANVGFLKYVLNVTSTGASPSINGVYGESLISLGQIFGGATSDGYTLNSCSFAFPDTPDTHLAVDAHLLNSANVICNGCSFGASFAETPTGDPLRVYNAGQLTFNDCTFGGRTADRAPMLWITGARERVQFHNCIMVDYQTPRPSGGFSTMTTLSSVLAVDGLSNYFGAQVVPGTIFYPVASGPTALRWVDGIYPTIELAATPVVVDAGTGSFDVPHAKAAGILPGDLISTDTTLQVWTTPGGNTHAALVVGKVASTAPSNTDPTQTTVTVRLVPESVAQAAGTPLHLLLMWLPRVHPPTTGTITDGSADITDVSSLSSSANSSLPQPWDENQRVLGAFIPEGSYVKQIALGTRTITLNQPVQLFPAGSSMTVRIYDADVREISRVQHLLDAVPRSSDRSETKELRFDEGIKLAAQRLGVPGQKLRIHAMVNVSGLDTTAMVPPVLILRVRLGGLLLGSTAPVAVAVNDQGIFHLDVDIRSPTQLVCHGTSSLGPLGTAEPVSTGIAGPATYDSTQTLDVVVTAQWIATGNTGSNVARLEAFTVEQVG